MRVSRLLASPAALIVIVASSWIRAESTPEARQWLDRLGALQTPFTVEYSGLMKPPPTGVQVRGRITRGDDGRFRFEFSMKAPTPDGSGTLRTSLLGVSDGEVLWIEERLGTDRRVSRLPLARVKELEAKYPIVSKVAGLDVVASTVALGKQFDFEVVSRSARTITLQGRPVPSPESAPVEHRAKQVFIVLDTKTSFPTELRIRGPGTQYEEHLSSVKFHDAGSLDPALFKYTPPGDSEVVDLGAGDDRLVSPELPPYKLELEQHGDVIRNPVWGIELEIPGFEYWADHGGNDQPNFVLAAHSRGECELNLSMFVERFREGGSAEECRREYRGNPEQLARQREVVIHEQQASPLTYTLFDERHDAAGGALLSQLFGYWTRGELCFELHISGMGCPTFAKEAMPILRSVQLSEDRGATLETVGVALEMGGDPRDWRLHYFVASAYLHAENGADPARARRFYESTLTRAGSTLDPKALWTVEEGLGLSWLMEKNGKDALPHLDRALRVASEIGEPTMIEDTLHNLACAQGLSGDVDSACASLRQLLSGLGPGRRRAKLAELRNDEQLREVIEAACFEALLRELGTD